MTVKTEVLTIQHEKHVAVLTTHCDGPACPNTFQEIDRSAPQQYQGDSSTPALESREGWWILAQDNGGNAYEPGKRLWFCSWPCVRNAMLGMSQP